MIRVVLLGASGSIGKSTLAVLRQHREHFQLVAVAARTDWQGLLPIIEEFHPSICALEDNSAAMAMREALSRHHADVRVEAGADAITALSGMAQVDVVVAGISGFAGLPSTWAAVRAGKAVLLANKEALVAAGRLLLDEARASGARLLPIDSEHNAAFQCLSGLECDRARVRAVTLTASGGPFRTRDLSTFGSITPEEACKHPTWSMGRKISVDSATLMNKGLEVIEASLLFNRPARDIRVLIHPTSTVHAIVEFVDGSMLAHLGPADMQVPIAHALAQLLPARDGAAPDTENRLSLSVPPLSLATARTLEFFDVDAERFPALELAYQALERGQGACLALNAANEVAVAAFLDGSLRYTDIVLLTERTLERVDLSEPTSIEEVFARDELVRRETQQLLSNMPMKARA
jgi:1-deoxy-D-xylulose-5-phosphate reductoisomerase